MSPLVGLSGCVKLLSIIAAATLVYVLLLRLGDRALWNRLYLSARQVLA